MRNLVVLRRLSVFALCLCLIISTLATTGAAEGEFDMVFVESDASDTVQDGQENVVATPADNASDTAVFYSPAESGIRNDSHTLNIDIFLANMRPVADILSLDIEIPDPEHIAEDVSDFESGYYLDSFYDNMGLFMEAEEDRSICYVSLSAWEDANDSEMWDSVLTSARDLFKVYAISAYACVYDFVPVSFVNELDSELEALFAPVDPDDPDLYHDSQGLFLSRHGLADFIGFEIQFETYDDSDKMDMSCSLYPEVDQILR